MAFTYNTDLSTDRDKVRFYTGDTDESTHQLADATIDALITLEGDYKAATIEALEGLLAKINREPDLTADWLRVNWQGSRGALEDQLLRLNRKWGSNKRTGSRKGAKRYDTRTPANTGTTELEDYLDDLFD